jgi:hypothetical protein
MTHNPNVLKKLSTAIAELPNEGVSEIRQAWTQAFLDLIDRDTPPGVACYYAYLSRDGDLLRRVFDKFPHAQWNKIVLQNKAIKSGVLIAEKNYNMLLAFRDAGISLQHNHHLFITAAKERDDPYPVIFLREELGDKRPLFAQKYFVDSLEQCGPGLAPLMWEEFQLHLNKFRGRAMLSFKQYYLGLMPLKPFAALLACGRDIQPFFRTQLHRADPHIVNLIEKTGSMHGQLSLKALEPDPVAVIARPAQSTFYGMDSKTFLKDFPLQVTSKQRRQN